MHKNSTKIDLDAFLGSLANPASQNVSSHYALPDSDRITIVGIFVDDSGSIRDGRLTKDVISGVELCVDSLKGAKSADFYLSIHGFRENYFEGMLHQFSPDEFQRKYIPNFNYSPLYSHTIRHMRDVKLRASEYARRGIPASLSYLIITDGLPSSLDDTPPSAFAELLDKTSLVVGIGVRQGNADGASYRKVFASMGIEKVLTPKATGSEIRHAVNEFSRSVASKAGA